MGLLRTFMISDAVEGAVEVRLELAEAIRSYRSRLMWTSVTLVTAISMALLSVFLQAFATAEVVLAVLEGSLGLDSTWWAIIAFNIILMALVIALGVTVLLFLGQNRRFIELMMARYGTLEGEGPSRRRKPREGKDLDEDEGSALDPARFLLGLAREAEGEVPQVDRVAKYSYALTFMLLGLMGLEVLLVVTGLTALPASMDIAVVVLQGLGLLLLVIAILLLNETFGFIRYLIMRVAALKAFEDQGPVPVPEGETPVERFLASLAAEQDMEVEGVGPARARGASGTDHPFDAALGEGAERVLVRVFDREPALGDLKGLREAAQDVARRDGELPLRVVALVAGELEDLDVGDAEYDFLMEHPIKGEDGVWARSVQIVAEVEGHYTMLPFVVS